jgi:hypothetical protein
VSPFGEWSREGIGAWLQEGVYRGTKELTGRGRKKKAGMIDGMIGGIIKHINDPKPRHAIGN